MHLFDQIHDHSLYTELSTQFHGHEFTLRELRVQFNQVKLYHHNYHKMKRAIRQSGEDTVIKK